MRFLQKRIIFADFCFQSIDMAQINVVLQELLQRNKRYKGKLHFGSFFGKSRLGRKVGPKAPDK